MKLIYKKSVLLLFSLLSLVSLFGASTINTQASEKLNPQEQKIYNAMTKEEQKEYEKIKKLEPKTPLTEEQKIKFDQFVKLENNRYIIIDSKELKGEDKKIIKEYVNYSNYLMKNFDFSNSNVKVEDKTIKIIVESTSRGYGYTYFQWEWWGFHGGINQYHFSNFCRNYQRLSDLANMLRINWHIAVRIADAIIYYGVCWRTDSGVYFSISGAVRESRIW